MTPNKYPDLGFLLNTGRRLQVNTFFWEPSYAETVELDSDGQTKSVTIERKRLQVDTVVGHRKVHVIGPDFVDKYQTASPRIPNSAVTVLLSSTPLSDDALYSELVVIFFIDHRPGCSIEGMLEGALRDLDWEMLAVDVTEAKNELWKEVWVERTVH